MSLISKRTAIVNDLLSKSGVIRIASLVELWTDWSRYVGRDVRKPSFKQLYETDLAVVDAGIKERQKFNEMLGEWAFFSQQTGQFFKPRGLVDVDFMDTQLDEKRGEASSTCGETLGSAAWFALWLAYGGVLAFIGSVLAGPLGAGIGGIVWICHFGRSLRTKLRNRHLPPNAVVLGPLRERLETNLTKWNEGDLTEIEELNATLPTWEPKNSSSNTVPTAEARVEPSKTESVSAVPTSDPQKQARTYGRVQVIGVIFRWMGLLLLVSAVIGLILFLTDKKLWTGRLDAEWVAGIGFILFVPLFLFGWTLLRTGLGLRKFVPQARRFAIGLSFVGLPLVSLGIPYLSTFLMSPEVAARFITQNFIVVVATWGSLIGLFIWSLIVLMSKTSQTVFSEAQDHAATSATINEQMAARNRAGLERASVNSEKSKSSIAMNTGNGEIKPRPEANSRSSPKVKINAKAVVHDIQIGLDDVALMQKYGLSARQLTALYKKLEEAGLLKKA